MGELIDKLIEEHSYYSEHTDHQDYKFPVIAEFIGVAEVVPDWDHSYENDAHALIYTDGNIAMTMYECCYQIWYVETGKYLMGDLFDKHWKLTDDSIAAIKEFCKENNIRQ